VRRDCLSIEELAAGASWPADDPRRGHLESCTRCRSLLLSLEEFLSPTDMPPGADPEAARRKLVTDFRDTAPAKGAAVDAPTAEPRERAGGFIASLFRPAWKPALALAVLLVVAIELPRRFERSVETDRIILRDGGAPPDARAIRTRLPRSGAEAGASLVQLSWHGMADSLSYRVTFFDAEFQEIAQREAGMDTVMTLRPGDLPVPWERWGLLFWQVTGWRGGDPIARSLMASLDFSGE
jgi:hypothetical protein